MAGSEEHNVAQASPALGASAPGPLAGLRVLELGSLIAGPLATRILADFGAQVIKVEPPEGDPLRGWGILTEHGSLWSMVQARNKQTITLDLKKEKARDLVRRLAAESDVVVENFRPGRLEAWGLGYDDLKRINPRLVMVRISGYGQTGPYKDRPGFGNIAEAMGGIRYVTGFQDRPPVRVGLSIGDSLAALYAVIGSLLALYRRDAVPVRGQLAPDAPGGDCRNGASGTGQVVDVALTEAVFSLLESILPEYAAFGAVRERQGNTLATAAPSNVYPTRDGKWLAIGANGDSIFRRFTALIGQPELAEDPRFIDNAARVAHVDKIDGIIEDWTLGHDMNELIELLAGAGVPAGPVYSIADIAADLQFQARQMILEVPDARIGRVTMPGVVPVLTETPGSVRWAGPAIGADNHEVLRSVLGLSDEEIEGLADEGVI